MVGCRGIRCEAELLDPGELMFLVNEIRSPVYLKASIDSEFNLMGIEADRLYFSSKKTLQFPHQHTVTRIQHAHQDRRLGILQGISEYHHVTLQAVTTAQQAHRCRIQIKMRKLSKRLREACRNGSLRGVWWR